MTIHTIHALILMSTNFSIIQNSTNTSTSNAKMSSESHKNRIAEYQADKTALKRINQSQVCIMAGSKR